MSVSILGCDILLSSASFVFGWRRALGPLLSVFLVCSRSGFFVSSRFYGSTFAPSLVLRAGWLSCSRRIRFPFAAGESLVVRRGPFVLADLSEFS